MVDWYNKYLTTQGQLEAFLKATAKFIKSYEEELGRIMHFMEPESKEEMAYFKGMQRALEIFMDKYAQFTKDISEI